MSSPKPTPPFEPQPTPYARLISPHREAGRRFFGSSMLSPLKSQRSPGAFGWSTVSPCSTIMRAPGRDSSTAACDRYSAGIVVSRLVGQDARRVAIVALYRNGPTPESLTTSLPTVVREPLPLGAP